MFQKVNSKPGNPVGRSDIVAGDGHVAAAAAAASSSSTDAGPTNRHDPASNGTVDVVLPPDRSVVMDIDVDDDDGSVIEIVPSDTNATATTKVQAGAKSIASAPDVDLNIEVVEGKPPKLKPPPNAAGRAPPASTQEVMMATTTDGTAPSLAPKSNVQPPRSNLKPLLGARRRAPSSVRPGTKSPKRIKVGASLAAISGRPAAATESKPPGVLTLLSQDRVCGHGNQGDDVDLDTKPAVSTGKGKSDETSTSHARQQSHGAVDLSKGNDSRTTERKPEDNKKPRIVDLLMDAFGALEITSTTDTTTASIESDPEASNVIAVLKHHRKLESILEKDVGPRHEFGLASDDDLLDACSDIAASEKELFELAKLCLEFDLQDVDEASDLPASESDELLKSEGNDLPQSMAVEPPKSKVGEPPEPSTDDPIASDSVPQTTRAGSSSGRGPKVRASGFVKCDWCDFKTADGNPDWDTIQDFYDETPPSREKDAIKCILDLRGTPDIPHGGEVHHIIPRSLGGSNDKANLRRVETVKHIYLHGSLHVVSYNWQNAAAFAFMTDTRGKRTGMSHILDDEDLMKDLAKARDAASAASSERMLKRWSQPGVREYMRQRVRDAMAQPKVREAIRKFWANMQVCIEASARMRKIQADKRAAEGRDVGPKALPCCMVTDCKKVGQYSGMCRVHCRRANNGKMSKSMKCKVESCNNGCRAGGLCCYHTAIQAEMNTVTTQLTTLDTISHEELTELIWPTPTPLVLRSERLQRDGKWICIVQDCITLAEQRRTRCGKHRSIQAKIDAALAKRPPGLHEMTLPELQITVSDALEDKLKDLEKKFASPSPRSKGQHVSRLDPTNERFLEAFKNASRAGKATGTVIGQLLKDANGGVIRLYSEELEQVVCFRYATDEEAASIAPSADAVNAAKAALESFVNRPSNKHHSRDDIPVTQLDPKNQGAFLRTFPSISDAARKKGITGSLLQTKVKDAHKEGKPYAKVYAYCADDNDATQVVDAVECWFRYATDAEIAKIPPLLRKRRGRKSALAAASEDPAVSEENVVESPPSPAHKPPQAAVQPAMYLSSAKIGTEAEWYEGDSGDESDFD